MNRERLIPAGLIVLLTIVVYLPALRGGFVWDDASLITENRLVHVPDGLYRIWCTTEPTDYWPLTFTAWWLEWRCWGAHAVGYHIVNVLLHATNAVLLWLLLRQLKIPGAWLAGLVFAIHPVNAATVAWISEQKNTLAMFFYALAILCYLRFDEQGRRAWYGLSFGMFLLALLCKTAVVLFPVVILACVWWRRREVRWKDVGRAIPFMILAVGLGLVTLRFQNQHRHSVELPADSVSLAVRLAVAGRAPWFYLAKVLCPVGLAAIYPKWKPDAGQWGAYIPGLAILAGFGWLLWKRKTWGRPWLFAAGYFVIMLAPVLGLVDQSFHRLSWVADPWLYFSIIAPIALVTAAAKAVRDRALWASLGVMALAGLGAGTWKRAQVYQSGETLWQDNLAKNTESWMPYYNLGTDLMENGKPAEAIAYLERAVQLRPDFIKARVNLGIALAQSGRMPAAIAQFEQALWMDPNLGDVHADLGHALLLDGRPAEAIQHWREALRCDPGKAEVHYDLGLALEQQGNTNAARDHYASALKINPGMTQARDELARIQNERR